MKPSKRKFLSILYKIGKPTAYPRELQVAGESCAFYLNGAFVALDVYQKHVFVPRIRVRPCWAGRGKGSAALRTLCETADAAGMQLGLHVRAGAHRRLSTTELVKWYERYGFVKTVQHVGWVEMEREVGT